MFTKEEIIKELPGVDLAHSERYAIYCETWKDKESKGFRSNAWMDKFSAKQLAEKFRAVELLGLVFDGIHITLQSTGISFDYVAYKTKMYTTYPETIFDSGIVYKGDKFSFSKENGKVIYSHGFANPFEKKESEIIGAYSVVRNRR